MTHSEVRQGQEWARPISRLEAFGSPIRSVFIIMLWQAAGHITTTRNARMHA